jgi:hypothetical protein
MPLPGYVDTLMGLDGGTTATEIMNALDSAGYTIVPKEPSPEMIDAAMDTVGMKAVNSMLVIAHVHGADLPDQCVTRSPLNQAWDAMIAVAR